MTPASAAENPRTSFRDRIESITKLGAMLFALTYGAGFLVVCLHHAQFGIAELSLLKIRVLSAGVVFFTLTLVPVIATARVFGYFGLESKTGFAITSSPEHRPFQQIVLVMAMYAVAVGLALSSAGLLLVYEVVPDKHPFWWTGLVYFGITSIMTGFVPVLSRYFPNHPRKSLAAAGVLMPVLGLLVYLWFGEAYLDLSLWYYACAVATYGIRVGVRDQGWLRNFEVERHLAIPLGLIAGFSIFIYGSVRPEIGGGSPVPVQVYVNSEGAKVLGGETATAWLIEETDYGLYLLRHRDERKALLLPRSLIRAVEFRADTNSPKAPASSKP